MKKKIIFLDWTFGLPWYENRVTNAFFGLNIPRIFEQFFEIEIYDSHKKYDKSRCVFVIMNIYSKKKFEENLPKYKLLESQGYKVVLWCFAEYPPLHHWDVFQKFPNFYVPHWFWFQEIGRHIDRYHSFYKQNGLVFHKANYPRVENRSKIALMPLGKDKPWRRDLYRKVNRFLPNMVYSYLAKEIFLPRNVDFENDVNFYEIKGNLNDRYFNPQWYNETYFSLVSETFIDKVNFKYNKQNEDAAVFLTEKTFKPIMYRHPFMIWGQPGSLVYLKKLGFETFENLFDESYDTIEDYNIRLDRIVDNLKNLKEYLSFKHRNSSIHNYDKLTQEKIEHNHYLFFDENVVESRLVNDLVLPFLEMCE